MLEFIKQLFCDKYKGLSANKAFIRQILSGYTEDNNIYITDTEMYLPSKKDIQEALDKIPLSDNEYNTETFYCKHFMVKLWSQLIDITEDWAMGYVILQGDKYRHIAVCIIDDKGDVHVIDGQTKENRLLTKKDKVWYLFI